MEGNYARQASDPIDAITGDRYTSDYSPRTAWSTGLVGLALFGITLILLIGSAGCQDQVSLIPNTDPELRKTRTEFARDAINRFPYNVEAPRAGKIKGGATADYAANTLQVANFTAEDWKNVEIWVNGQWVVFVPFIPGEAATAKTINFEMLYDRMGRPFPNDNTDRDTMVNKVEILRDGKMYELAGLSVE